MGTRTGGIKKIKKREVGDKGVGKRKVARRDRRRLTMNGNSCLSNFNENLFLHAYNPYL
jgi:hypothetical protein